MDALQLIELGINMDPITLAVLLLSTTVFVSNKKSKRREILGIPKEQKFDQPTGKGLFVDNLIIENVQDFSNFLKSKDIQWLAVPFYKNEKLIPLELGKLKYLSDQGIKIWLWGIPSPYDIDNLIKLCQKYEVHSFCSGFIFKIDPGFISEKTKHAFTVLISTAQFNLIKPFGVVSEDINLPKATSYFQMFIQKQESISYNGIPVFVFKPSKSLNVYGIWGIDFI